MSIRFPAILIFIFGLFLFTIGLSSQEIIGFESRFYLFALEMWRHGPTWFPTTYQQPYPDYPGTATFLIYLTSKLMGGMSKFTAILPSAIAAAGTLSVTYLIGALHSQRWGFCAALFLLFTSTFLMEARTISLDQFTTFLTALCFYLVYSASLLQKPRRVVWVFPLMILSFAFRGPIGLVIPAGITCVYFLLEKDFKRFFTVGLIAAVLLLIACTLLLAIAYHVGGMPFLQNVLHMEVLGRMQEMKTPPGYFYFVESFGAYAMTYPLAFLALPGIVLLGHKSKEGKLLQQLLVWAFVILIGLSIPADKKVRYILPMAPALALICGYLFVVQKHVYLTLLQRIFSLFCLIFPAICLVMVFLIHQKHPDLFFYFTYIVGLLIVLQLAILLFWRRKVRVLCLSTLAFVAAYILVVEAINVDLNRTQEFVHQVEDMRLEQHAGLAFYHQGTDGLVIKYLANMPEEDQPVFISNSAALGELKSRTVVIATDEDFQEIPNKNAMHVIERGKIGREPVVVFSRSVFHPQGEF